MSAPPPPQPTVKSCTECGTQFECGATLAQCWCQNLPPLALNKIDPRTDCRCPSCLAATLQAAAADSN